MSIQLNAYDLSIGEFTDKNTGEKREIARIDSRLAFNDDFIRSLKEAGVKKYIRVEKEDDREVDTTGIL